jgi:hypothetical protein
MKFHSNKFDSLKKTTQTTLLILFSKVVFESENEFV